MLHAAIYPSSKIHFKLQAFQPALAPPPAGPISWPAAPGPAPGPQAAWLLLVSTLLVEVQLSSNYSASSEQRAFLRKPKATTA